MKLFIVIFEIMNLFFLSSKILIKYEDLFQYLNELKNISEYDNEEDAKMKIISFIEIMNKAKS